MAGRAGCSDVVFFAVQPSKARMAGVATEHGMGFCLFQVTRCTGHRHHWGRCGNVMAGNTIQGWPVSCPVAEMAQDFSMRSPQGPRMPRLSAGNRRRTEGEKRFPLGDGMANRTGAGKNLARLVHVSIIVTPEATRPITMADIVGISCPVDIHAWEDIPVVDGQHGLDGLVELVPSLLQYIGVSGVVVFDILTDFSMNVPCITVVSNQGIYRDLLDPGQS